MLDPLPAKHRRRLTGHDNIEMLFRLNMCASPRIQPPKLIMAVIDDIMIKLYHHQSAIHFMHVQTDLNIRTMLQSQCKVPLRTRIQLFITRFPSLSRLCRISRLIRLQLHQSLPTSRTVCETNLISRRKLHNTPQEMSQTVIYNSISFSLYVKDSPSQYPTPFPYSSGVSASSFANILSILGKCLFNNKFLGVCVKAPNT